MSLFDELERLPHLSPKEVVRELIAEAEDHLDPRYRPWFWSDKDCEFYSWAIDDLAIDPHSFRLGYLVGLALGDRDAATAQAKRRARRRTSRWDLARRIWLEMTKKGKRPTPKDVWGRLPREKAGELHSFQADWAKHVKKWQKELSLAQD